MLTLPCGFMLYDAARRGLPLGIAIWGGILLILWGAFALLWKEVRYAVPISVALVFPLWALLLWQTGRRILFMLESGLEEPDGTGSPAAFLIGIVTEQYFFVPLTFVLASALDILLATRRERYAKER